MIAQNTAVQRGTYVQVPGEGTSRYPTIQFQAKSNLGEHYPVGPESPLYKFSSRELATAIAPTEAGGSATKFALFYGVFFSILLSDISFFLRTTANRTHLAGLDRFGLSPRSMTLTLAVSRFSGPAKPGSRCWDLRGTVQPRS